MDHPRGIGSALEPPFRGEFVSPSRKSRLRAAAALGAFVLVAGTATTAAAASHPDPATRHLMATTGASATDIGYAIDKPLCKTKVRRGYMNCFAMQRVPVRRGTPGARPYLKRVPSTSRPATLTLGPANGYTPADLAAAYGFNPDTPRTNQLVAIIDWYNDPHARSDLNKFDARYSLPKETASSFQIVNQKGQPYPNQKDSGTSASLKGKDSAGEIMLDVESVRAVCHTCRILLVEATDGRADHLATAENTAASLGATEISNSYGGPEFLPFPKVLKDAYNHPGVVITASTGDDGWFDWDFSNDTGNPTGSSNAPEFPASSPNVVSVGGTTLILSGTGAVISQAVWNNNGLSDQIGHSGDSTFDPGPEGASGGGCSVAFGAPAWQKNFAGYSATGCGKRLSADVSLIGDPQYGFDTYDSWSPPPPPPTAWPWTTVGGTSLSSPIVAAMYALAGGGGGAAYPASSLYTNASLHPSEVFDVVDGGNGFCGGDTVSNCGNAALARSSGSTNNPNALGFSNVDCSFPSPTTTTVAPLPPPSSECNAAPAYDGASGVGAPTTSGLFTPTNPRISISHPSKLRLHKTASFTIHDTPRITGTTVKTALVDWGDGKQTSGTALTKSHTYTKPGHYFVVAIIVDNLNQESFAFTTVTVGKKLIAHIFGPTRTKQRHKARFHLTASDPNTGGKIKSISWSWGDGHHSSGKRVSHTWHKHGRYKIKITLRDNTGVKTTYIRHERVK
jgi:hypothetical protein